MPTTSHLAHLSQLLSAREIITDSSLIEPYCTDQRGRYHGQVFAVLQPHSVSAVQSILRYCQQQQIPITPQGGNTGLCGAATPHSCTAGKGIILSLSKLNRVRKLSLADNTITVEAGMILADVQAVAKQANRYFPLSLASEGSCQIGGNIACNAGGLNVVRYGTMRDLVLGLEYVLPDGQLVSHLNPLHKNTSGYEMSQQIIGSEGTLAIITAATLKLFAPPQSILTAWVGLENIQAATNLLSALKNHFAERLSSFELISQAALNLSARYSQLQEPVNAKWHILFELTDSLPTQDLTEPLINVLEQGNWLNAIIADSETKRQHLWTLRENISAAQRSLGASIKHDIVVPIEKVADFIESCQQHLLTAFPQTKTILFGHLGDGSLHYNVFIADIRSNDVYHYEKEINQVVYEQVLQHQGSIAAEHGIGQLKNQWLSQVRTPAEINWMWAQKHYFDPKNILNPGKVLPPQP
ncbi:MAG: FAD-binding oxidoreductase [Snodgrassella alvi]